MVLAEDSGKIECANAATFEIFGWKNPDLVGKHLQSFFSSHVSACLDHFIENAEQVQTSAQVPFRCADGSSKDVEWHVRKLNSQLLFYCHDMTASLREKKFLEQAQQKALLGSWEIDILKSSVFVTQEYLNLIDSGAAVKISDLSAFLSSYPIEFRQKIELGFVDLFNGGKPFSFEFSINTQSGEVRWLEFNAKADAKFGQIVKAYGTLQEVSQRVEIDKALRLSYERLAVHFHNSPLGIIEFDQNGKIQTWNRSASQILGYSEQEAVGQSWTLITPLQNQNVDKDILWKQAQNTTFGTRISTLSRHKNGEKIPTEWYNTTLKSPEGEFLGVSSIIQDITEKKSYEKKLAEQSELLASVLKGSPDTILEVDRTGKILFVNRMDDILMNNHAPYTSIFEVVPNASHDHLKKIIDLCLRSGRSGNIYYDTTTSSGQARFFSVRIIPKNSKGLSNTLILTCTDITEEKFLRMQLESHQLKMIANSRLGAVGELASGLVHEIHNPLAVISGVAEKIIRTIASAELDKRDAEKDCQKILFSVQRIMKISQSLRSFVREQEGDELKLIDMGQLLNDLFDLCQTRIEGRGIQIRNKSSQEEFWALGRPSQLLQILSNLIQNSIEAILGSRNPWIEISLERKESEIEVSISDSGPGIPEEIQDRIFQPFFTTKPTSLGTGLGLSVAQNLAKENGGELQLDRSAKSTRFVLKVGTPDKKLKKIAA